MSRRKSEFRPDLAVPVELWGTIKSATEKLTWLARVDTAIAAGMVDGSFAQLAINIATNPKGVNSQTGLTWRSTRTLADIVGLAQPTVVRLLKQAVAAGLLFVVREGRPGRDGQSTMYRLAMPEAGNDPPVRRFRRKKRSTHEPKNRPGNDPSMVPETIHSDPRKRLTSGSKLLRDSISVENKLPVAAEGGANTARGGGYTADAVRPSVDDAAEPDGVVSRAEARTEPVEAQQQPPSHASKNIGAAPNRANAGLSRDQAYAALWHAYPNHTSEADARELFHQLMDEGVDPDVLIAGAAAYAKRCEGTDPVRIRLLCHWLRGRGWEDQIDAGDTTTAREREHERRRHPASSQKPR